MEELWPAPSPEGGELIRSVCQQLLVDADEILEAVNEPSLLAQHDEALLSDASLSHEDHLANRSDLAQWLSSNIHDPGRRVPVHIGSRTTAYLRDLASRGIEPDFVDGWRTGLAIVWRRWLQECLSQCDDPALLTEVLAIVPLSVAQYTLDWFAALQDAVLANAADAAEADVVATIQLIVSGAPIPPDFAEARLGHRLTQWHQALITWVDDPRHADTLDRAIAAVHSASAGRSALVARASTTSRWIWVSGPTSDDLPPVEKALSGVEHVQTALGRPGSGLAGFRASHQDALAAQAMIVRLDSDQPFTAYGEVELIDALTKDRASARRLVTDTLGPLVDADETLRQALLTYMQCGFNTTRAAARLYTHRNTVERRVSRANELAVVKVDDNPAQLAAALLVLEVAPGLAATSPRG